MFIDCFCTQTQFIPSTAWREGSQQDVKKAETVNLFITLHMLHNKDLLSSI